MKRVVSVVVLLLVSLGLMAGILEMTENLVAAKPYKIAVLLKTLANPFWVSMQQGILDEAKRLGIQVDVYSVPTEGDIQGQLTILETIVQKDYDGIAVAPITPTNLIPGIVKANRKGIPVVNLDESVDREALHKAGGSIVGFVTTNNFNVGKQAAYFIAEKIGGVGEVAIIEGMAGNKSGEDRKNGFIAGVSEYPGIKVVASQPANWDRLMALDVAKNMLQRFPNLKAIYCANDTMALGAAQAVINAGKQGKIIVVGTDGIPEALKAIKEGRLTATVAQDPYNIGVAGLRILVFTLNAMNGEVPSKLITAENVE
ncbi:MAG TPA: allose ABC transporter [Thermotogae bacterium]|nr:allose ABC transporter [Thermotogota bacterium]